MPDALQQGGMGEAFMAPLRGAVDDEQLTMGIAFARVQHPNMYRGPDGACELRCYLPASSYPRGPDLAFRFTLCVASRIQCTEHVYTVHVPPDRVRL